MMQISYLTIFPEVYENYLSSVLVERARKQGTLQTQCIDIKDFAHGSFRHIDDSPYGGGAGMLLKCQPVLDALDSIKTENCHVVALDPCGPTLTQQKVHELAKYEHLIFLAGHYEGFDARIYDEVDECLSIGDYILSGGEFASMIVSDAIIRVLKGTLRCESTAIESFENHRLEYPQYTKPYEYNGKKVPDVLLSGDHQKIADYQTLQSLKRTIALRPDLIEKYPLTPEEIHILEEDES